MLTDNTGITNQPSKTIPPSVGATPLMPSPSDPPNADSDPLAKENSATDSNPPQSMEANESAEPKFDPENTETTPSQPSAKGPSLNVDFGWTMEESLQNIPKPPGSHQVELFETEPPPWELAVEDDVAVASVVFSTAPHGPYDTEFPMIFEIT